MGSGGRRRHRAGTAAALVAIAISSACSTGGAGDRPPEPWPPRSALECLRHRPPVGNPVIWPAALAVRDWLQPVTDGRLTVVLCAQGTGSSSGSALVVTVSGSGAVSAPPGGPSSWDTMTDLVLPVTATVSGPGTLVVDLSTTALTPSGRPSAAQRMTVHVLRDPSGLVVSECRMPASCAWD